MRVAVVTGICVERDAISAAAADQALALQQFDGVDDVVLIAQHHDRRCPAKTVTATDSWSLVRSAEMRTADAVIFHWGIRYDLFNALPLLAPDRATVVHFHNVTPAALWSEPERDVFEQSTRQIQLPSFTGTPLWAVSEHNRERLLDWGYEEHTVRVVPITVERSTAPRRQREPGEAVRLLTVGRLVAAKGVDVLVEAMAIAVDRLPGRISLVLAGSSSHSDHSFVDRLLTSIRRYGLDDVIEIKQDLDDRDLAREYHRADVLVSPSLHEGLCMPVIEAYQAGLRVIGSDAGNLPYVVQPPDPVVPAGQPGPLADAIIAVSTELIEGRSEVPPGAAALVHRYSASNVRAELAEALSALTGASVQPFGLVAST